jgi:hypothetical protein
MVLDIRDKPRSKASCYMEIQSGALALSVAVFLHRVQEEQDRSWGMLQKELSAELGRHTVRFRGLLLPEMSSQITFRRTDNARGVGVSHSILTSPGTDTTAYGMCKFSLPRI